MTIRSTLALSTTVPSSSAAALRSRELPGHLKVDGVLFQRLSAFRDTAGRPAAADYQAADDSRLTVFSMTTGGDRMSDDKVTLDNPVDRGPRAHDGLVDVLAVQREATLARAAVTDEGEVVFWARLRHRRFGTLFSKVTRRAQVARDWHREPYIEVLEHGTGLPPWEEVEPQSAPATAEVITTPALPASAERAKPEQRVSDADANSGSGKPEAAVVPHHEPPPTTSVAGTAETTPPAPSASGDANNSEPARAVLKIDVHSRVIDSVLDTLTELPDVRIRNACRDLRRLVATHRVKGYVPPRYRVGF